MLFHGEQHAEAGARNILDICQIQNNGFGSIVEKRRDFILEHDIRVGVDGTVRYHGEITRFFCVGVDLDMHGDSVARRFVSGNGMCYTE